MNPILEKPKYLNLAFSVFCLNFQEATHTYILQIVVFSQLSLIDMNVNKEYQKIPCAVEFSGDRCFILGRIKLVQTL